LSQVSRYEPEVLGPLWRAALAHQWAAAGAVFLRTRYATALILLPQDSIPHHCLRMPRERSMYHHLRTADRHQSEARS